MTTFVYFIQEVYNGFIKVGHSRRPTERLAACQTGNPRELHLIGMMPGGRGLERTLHQRFREHHMQGEWFAPGDDLVAFIRENAVDPEAR